MAQKKSYIFFRKNWWITVLLALSAAGIVLGCWGFDIQNFSGNLYETFRLFVLGVSFEQPELLWQLQWARWLIFAAFLWATFRLFFEIMAPQYFQNLKVQFYRNHIIICGLNKITLNLAEKYANRKIVVLANETNHFAETLKQKNIPLLTGNLADEIFLKKSGICKAYQLYIVTESDQMNVEIAQTLFSVLEKKKPAKALKCFTLIKDRQLKILLEESALFKCKADTFDGVLFNINEMGVKYGISTNVDKILPEKIETAPEILLVGLNEKTEIALMNMVHCLTMQRESFRFTIAEKHSENVDWFEKQCQKLHLRDFAEIEIFRDDLDAICTKKAYHSIFICTENQTDALKQAVEIHYLLGKYAPNILMLCDDAGTFSRVLEAELEKKKIFPVHLFEQIAAYVFELDKNIEEKAKETHYFWNSLYDQNTEWDSTTGHFKQSNRNQILDNYLRIFIARGEKFEKFTHREVSFSEQEKETLAMMEHRRWMLEKFENGWVLGARDNNYKRHNCLIPWEELSEKEKSKDFEPINLMLKLLKNQNEYDGNRI